MDDNETTTAKNLSDHTIDKQALKKYTEKLAQASPTVEQIEVLACQNITEISATVHSCKSESEINEPPCKLSPYDPSLFCVKVENVSLVQGPGDPAEIKSLTKTAESSSVHESENAENPPNREEGNRPTNPAAPDSDPDTIPGGASPGENLTDDENLSRSGQQNRNTDEEVETPDTKTKDSGYVQFCERGRVPNFLATLAVLGLPESGKSSLIRTLLDLPFLDDKSPGCLDKKPSVFFAEATGTDWKLLDATVNLNPNLDTEAEQSTAGVDVVAKEELTRPSGKLTSVADQPVVLKIMAIDGLPLAFGSSMVFLMVLDITKELDKMLPKSCPVIGETTQREYLNRVLNMISTFVEKTATPDENPLGRSIIIVLTGIDELDPTTKEDNIQAFTKKMLDHLKDQYPCKYVENKIFVLSSKDKNEDDVIQLKELIMKLCKSKDTFGEPVPTSWLPLQARLQNNSHTSGKRWMTLREIQDNVGLPNEIPLEGIKEMLKFHIKLGSIVSDNEESVESLIITDPMFLTDTLSSIISMREPETISQLVLEKQGKLERELRKGIVSEATLNVLWGFLGLPHQERLVSVLVNLHQLIPCHQEIPNRQNSANNKFILPFLLPREQMSAEFFDRLQEAVVPLQYLFHKSRHDDIDEVKAAAYLPHNFVYSLLAHLIENTASWELKEMLSSGATFMSGRNGNVLVQISHHGPVLSLMAAIFPEADRDSLECEIAQVRTLFERGVEGLLQNYPGLHCSLSVYPCQGRDAESQATQNKLLCLHILGKIGEVGERPLRTATCFVHKRKLPSKRYKCWFCNELNQGVHQTKDNRNDQQILNDVAKGITDLATLRDVGIQLGVDYNDIERTVNDSNQQIKVASFKVLYKDWYCTETDADGDLQPGTPKRNKLKLALDASGLKNLL